MRKPLSYYLFIACLFTLMNTSVFGQTGSSCDYDYTPPRFTYCPSNIVIVTSDSFAIGNWRQPTATDNCGIPTVYADYYAYASGQRFREGTTPVSYTARDAHYNYASCRFTVTVSSPCMGDTVRPVISNCPSNIVVISVDSCTIVRWTEPKITDNCGVPALSSNFKSGDCFARGTTDVIYTGRDTRYNTTACKFAVIVSNLPCTTDTIKPIIKDCPQNQFVTTLDSCGRAYWYTPTATDNCSVPSFIASHQSGSCFNIGTTPVTYTATDPTGNTTTCQFSVIIDNPCLVDTLKPVIYCPQNMVIQTLDTIATAYWYAPYAYDNCSTPTVRVSRNNYTPFNVGITPIVYTATDARGNSSSCTFTITVNHVESFDPCFKDTIKPFLGICPQNRVVTTYDSCVYVPLESMYAYDNCSGNIAAISSHPFGTLFKAGTTIVTYTATDNAGNVATCQTLVTVNRLTPTDTCQIDTIAPEILNCPQSFVHQSLDSCVTIYWDYPTITDNCGTPSVTASHRSGACFQDGMTTVIYRATDGKGNKSTCQFTVTIENPCARDSIKPEFFSCPQNIVYTSLDSCRQAYWYAPTALDNCSTPSVISTHTSGDCFPLGSTKVTYTASDSKNNKTLCEFTVTIIDLCEGDSIKPTISSCPQNIVLTTLDSCAYAYWYTPSFYDNCSTPSVISTHTPGSCFPLGTTKVTYNATDSKHNQATCVFTVTIIDRCAGDTIKPSFTGCPQNIVLTSQDSVAYASWSVPTASDNCSYPIVSESHFPYSYFRIGTTNVTYIATDNKGNKGFCTFKIIVNNPCFNDSIKPIIKNCPANIVLNTTDSCAIARWIAPTATDNCTTPSVIGSYQSGECFKVGATTVTYYAKDAKNNVTNCYFTVNVINPCFTDTIKPIIKNCPASISLSSADSCSIARWTAPTATDNCSTPSVIGSHLSGFCFKVGSTTVTYTAKDAKNNAATCTFKVTVTNPCFTDSIKPTIYNCPANIAKSIPDSTVTITWKVPTAIDNCGATTLTTTNQPNSLFKVGTTTVVYTAADSRNNKTTCSFKVAITRVITPCSNDTTKPVFTSCPANISVATTATMSIAQWTTPTATDNCSTPSVSGTFNTGFTFPIGTTAVVFTATDAKGNAQYCRFNVTVIKNNTALILDSTKCYTLIARSSKKALSIANAATVAGAYAVQWTYLNTLNQKWKITTADSNSFNLTGKQSNLNLDTRWGATTEGARLMQWSKSAAAATQRWKLMLLTEGYYKVINKGSGLALSVSGGANVTADGGMMIQSNYTGLTSQQWTISEVPCTSTTANFATDDRIEMQAHPEFNRARIEWTDNTGYKNDYYEIQKLNQKSGEFEQLDIVNNKSFTNTPSYQTFYDNAPMDGDNTYRVKVIYLDSLSKFSHIKTLNFNGLETVKLFPNPANDYVDIDLSKFGNETINVYLYNSLGIQVAFQSVKKDKFSIVHFDTSKHQNGNYMLRITARGKRDILRQLQIVK
jgi:hypothetical protein